MPDFVSPLDEDDSWWFDEYREQLQDEGVLPARSALSDER